MIILVTRAELEIRIKDTFTKTRIKDLEYFLEKDCAKPNKPWRGNEFSI